MSLPSSELKMGNGLFQAATKVIYYLILTIVQSSSFGINAANQNSIVKGVNVWVVNANTNTVIEKIVDNKDIQVEYSASMSKYVLNIEHDRTYNHPIYFIAQATRTSGVGIAYSSGASNSSYLSTEAPTIGDVITPNSAIEAEFAVYCNNN